MERLNNAIIKMEDFYRGLQLGADSIMPYENNEVIISWLKELRVYREADEQGLIVRLPYPIGIPLYRVDYNAEVKIGCVTPTTMTLKNYADNREYFDKGMYFTSPEKANEKLKELDN